VTEGPDLARIEAYWGSEEALYDHFDLEVCALSKVVCGENAPVARLQLKPSWLSTGLSRTEPLAGADYEPPEGARAAVINIFPYSRPAHC